MRGITINFTVSEIDNLISCCNNKAIESEGEAYRKYGDFTFHLKYSQGFTRNSLIKFITSIREKLKVFRDEISNNDVNGSDSTDTTYPIELTIGEYIKLNSCCGCMIEHEEKYLSQLNLCTECTTKYNENITAVKQLKLKIKTGLERVYKVYL